MPAAAPLRPRWCCVDGRFVREDRALVPALDRGFLLGDGVFETVRVEGGVVELWQEHVTRMRRSAAAVRIRLPWSDSELEDQCLGVCRRSRLRSASVRITLSRGIWRGTLSDTGDLPRLVVVCRGLDEINPAHARDGVHIAVASAPRVHALDPSIKATMYLPAILARLEADEQGCYESLFLDPSGRVLELGTANFFGVRGGRVLTPPLRLGILPGVTRAIVLDLARRLHLRPREAILHKSDLATLDESFLTSAVRGVMPIVRIGGSHVGDGRPGPVTRLLQDTFSNFTGRAPVERSG